MTKTTTHHAITILTSIAASLALLIAITLARTPQAHADTPAGRPELTSIRADQVRGIDAATVADAV